MICEKLLLPDGGIRRAGRYLPTRKTANVVRAIRAKAEQALLTRGSTRLNVYIFAGLSGGTGSGCFLDVSYLPLQQGPVAKRTATGPKFHVILSD